MHHLDGKCRNHETALAREAKFWFDLYKFHVSCITCPNATVREPTLTPRVPESSARTSSLAARVTFFLLTVRNPRWERQKTTDGAPERDRSKSSKR